MTDRRFLVEHAELEKGSGRRAIVRGAEHHHLKAVLRLRPGDEVSLFDGRGSGCLGVIESIGRDGTVVTLQGPDTRSVEPEFRLVLVQGIPQHDRMDLVIQKTTELGVAEIAPVAAQRSQPRAVSSAGGKRLERWRRLAAEAARQSGRLVVPTVREPAPFAAFVRDAGESSPRTRLILAAPSGAGVRVEAIDRGCLTSGGGIVAVGPEGGWTAEEVEMAREAGYRVVSLGPRVLRTETAGIVATALVLYLAGEMGPSGGAVPAARATGPRNPLK